MPKVYNVKEISNLSEDFIYIGRPSKYGNPFLIGKDGTRKQVIQKFIDMLNSDIHLMNEIKNELKGKNLVCHCKPKECHGDYLLQIANEDDSIIWG